MMVGYVRDLLNCKWHGEGKKGEIVHHCKSEKASNRKWQAAMRIQMDTFVMPVSTGESDNRGRRVPPKNKHIKCLPFLPSKGLQGVGMKVIMTKTNQVSAFFKLLGKKKRSGGFQGCYYFLLLF